MTDSVSDKNGTEKPIIPTSVQKLQEELKEELKAVPDEQKRQRIAALISETILHIGPLPAPETLGQYNDVLPGLAERIVKMTENQNNHRIKQEDKVISSQVFLSKRGQLFGFILAIIFFFVAGFLGYTGHDWIAGELGTIDVVGLVAVFVLGRKQQTKELKEKAK